MNKHSFSSTEQRDSDKAADRAALSEVDTSELEGVNGGINAPLTPTAAGAYPVQMNGQWELNIKKTAVELNLFGPGE